MNVLLGIYIVGIIGYLLYAGYAGKKYNLVVKSHLLMIVAVFLWPLYVLMAIGTVIAKKRA
jgi:hypothetical protein